MCAHFERGAYKYLKVFGTGRETIGYIYQLGDFDSIECESSSLSYSTEDA